MEISSEAQAGFSMHEAQRLSLGNLFLKAFAKHSVVPAIRDIRELEELRSELMNAQCMFNYIEDVAPKYANYEEDFEVEWEIAVLLQQVEYVLSEVESMEMADPPTEPQRTMISKHRAKLCVYIHLACLHIMINSLEDEGNEIAVRVERFLCTFAHRFHEPISTKDNQFHDWLAKGSSPPTSDIPGENVSSNGQVKDPAEPNRRPLRPRARPTATKQFENAIKDPAAPGPARTHTNESIDEIGFKVLKQNRAGESEEWKFPLRHVHPNDKTLLQRQISVEILEEELGDTHEALQNTLNKLLQWLSRFPGSASMGNKFYSPAFLDFARDLETVGREMIKSNLLSQIEGASPHTTDLVLNPNFLGWTIREWMRLSRWWLLRGMAEKATANTRPRPHRKSIINGQTLNQYLAENQRGFNLYLPLLKAVCIFFNLIGGSGIWQLLDEKLRSEMEKLQKDIQMTCAQVGAGMGTFLREINSKMSKGKAPAPRNEARGDAEKSGFEFLGFFDAIHAYEERDGFDTDNIVVEFQVLAAITFNTRPSSPILNPDVATYGLVEIGYTDRKRNAPHIRLQNARGDIIKSAPLSQWMKLDLDEVEVRYDVDVWSIKVREMFVSFTLSREQDRVDFNGICDKIKAGVFLKTEKSKSWSIEEATYITSFTERLSCKTAKLTLTEKLLPGAQGKSRKRSIAIEPRYRGQMGFSIDHIPFHSIEVRDAAPKLTSNGAAIEISWQEQTVSQDEYLFSPYTERYPKIHHYHYDGANRLQYRSKHMKAPQTHNGSIRRVSESTNIPPDHSECRVTCTHHPDGSYFTQDGVIGEHLHEGSSWTCPFGEAESRNQNTIVKHWLTLNLTNNPSDLQEFYRTLFQKDPDELSLETHVYSSLSKPSNSKSKQNELHIFDSELFFERRVVKIEKVDNYKQIIRTSFVNTLSSLSSENVASNIQRYRLENMLSHPYGSRLFDGDVGRNWYSDSLLLSDYGIDKIDKFPILDVLCPYWVKVQDQTSLCNYMELTLRPMDQSKSKIWRAPEPIFERKNGNLRFYHDTKRGKLFCWTFGETGNSFIYFSINKISNKKLKLNNTIRLKVLYELNSVSGLDASLVRKTGENQEHSKKGFKAGLIDISFADSSSPFRVYCQTQMDAAGTGYYPDETATNDSSSTRLSIYIDQPSGSSR
ncbi:hypothetical protein TWF694_001964 [Orbilia ellipsospora]|uniref:Uncharacterized protein n=1 Tax=Orbilia ellipsospora TaxID=2528407 RepID=A0AAV9X452_9PEZI